MKTETYTIATEGLNNKLSYTDFPLKGTVRDDCIQTPHGNIDINTDETPFTPDDTVLIEWAIDTIIIHKQITQDRDNKTTEPVKLKIGRFVSPWISQLPIETTVTGSNTIEIGVTETQLATNTLDPGTKVKITKHNGDIVAKPLEYVQQEKKLQKSRRNQREEIKKRQRERKEEKKKQERAEFWDQYDIPIKFTTADNVRISELRRGSSGTGRTKHSVEHFLTLESFEDGRLERDKHEFLCRNEGDWYDLSMDEWEYEKSKEKTPQITCKTCLKRMKRWKNN